MTTPIIDPEEIAWIKSYEDTVVKLYGGEFKKAQDRLKNSHRLLNRFEQAISSLLSNGRDKIAGVNEAHNELCIASQLLANSSPKFTLVEYEPPLAGCTKSIDFLFQTALLNEYAQ